MKFGQLIEYNIRNFFLEILYPKCGTETTPRLFTEKSKLNLSLNQQFKVPYCLFLLYVKVEGYRNILKPISFTSYEAFLKSKKSGTNLPALFSP